MTFPLVHHPAYVAALPDGHSFPMRKYAHVIALLADTGFASHTPAPMPRDWIAAVHDGAYVDAVLAAAVDPATVRRIGLPVTAAVAARAQLVSGGTWLAAKLALRHGFAANAAGGSHHALPGGGAGYCVFNDLAVTANRLLAEGMVQRIMVVDLDVHQGDGTAAILAGRPDAFSFSMHAEKNFPTRKARSSRDVSLPDGMGDAAYLALLADELPPLLDGFAPDLVLFQAGVDPHEGDRLGRLALSGAGLAARDGFVVAQCRARGIPVASTLGGGYGTDAAAIAALHAAGLRAQWAAFEGAAAPTAYPAPNIFCLAPHPARA